MTITDGVVGFIDKFSGNRTTEAVKKAFTFLLPVFLIGALSLTLQHFPVTSVREFINGVWGGFFNGFLSAVYNATYGFASVYLVLALAYCVSNTMDLHKDVKIFLILSCILSYFASLGRVVYTKNADLISYTNMSNIFPAMLSSLAATYLFRTFYKLFNRNKSEHHSSFARSLHAILPLACCVASFALISTLIGLIPGIDNPNDLILKALSSLFESLGATYSSGAVIMIAESALWFFGVHGGNVFDNLLTDPEGAFAITNGQIMTKQFIDTFVLMGGCGTTVCLLVALLLFTKDKKKKRLCYLSGGPLLFNINELLVFGLPIVLNPIYLIPFILTPFVCYTSAYLATYWGLVPQIAAEASVQWTTPILISGYQATGSIAGSFLQLFQLVLGVAVYTPFVILDNKISKLNQSSYLKALTDICRSCEANEIPYSIDNQKYALRAFEDDLASALFDDVSKGNVQMRYQPQVENGKVVSAEALLRFAYNDCGYLYPPLAVAIACKNNMFAALSKEIVKRALSDLKTLQKTAPEFKIAVNLKLDLITDENFRQWLIQTVGDADINPHTFGVEITEDSKLTESENYINAFNQLKNACIEIYIDDFSMGHTSLSLLQKNFFDYVKIDGNLIKQLENERIQSIVSSVVQLGKRLHFAVIAEYVETEKQREILLGVGCNVLQGYLFYKDLDVNQLNGVLQKNGSDRESAKTETV